MGETEKFLEYDLFYRFVFSGKYEDAAEILAENGKDFGRGIPAKVLVMLSQGLRGKLGTIKLEELC